MIPSPPVLAGANLAYWAPENDGQLGQELDSEGVPEHPQQLEEGGKRDTRSMYVQQFESMIVTVLSCEGHLFDKEETDCFANYQALSYAARYLLVRLCLRKAGQWLALRDLKYSKELGDGILGAMRELCVGKNTQSLAAQEVHVKVEERDIIDLTFDGSTTAGPSSVTLDSELKVEVDVKPVVPNPEPDYGVFADDESKAELRDLLECLTRDELAQLVKDMKLRSERSRKDSFIDVLLNSTSTQRTLPFTAKSKKNKGKGVDTGMRQTTLDSFAQVRSSETQQDVLREIVVKKLGATIKLNPDVVKLFRRLNVVYFRSTQYTPSLMTAAILARAKKCTYPEYERQRTKYVWKTREALVAYEDALEIEGRVDMLFGGVMGSAAEKARARSRSVMSKTPAPVKHEVGHAGVSVEPPESMRLQDARAVKKQMELVYDQWKALVAEEDVVAEDEPPRPKALDRFHHGHVWTRIICKGAEALGIMKEHTEELAVLQELLAQRRFRRGRRGKWYERRALVIMTHMPKTQENRMLAYEGVLEALQDEDTHIVYRPKLRRRLEALEKKLAMAENERHTCDATLKKADEVFIVGDRVRPNHVYDATGRPIKGAARRKVEKAGKDEKQQVLQFPVNKVGTSSRAQSEVGEKEARSPSLTGKSVWRGRDNEEVTVEMFALQHYEKQGYKGFHCEGRIITTLFGLLCWDIIFAPIAGAFETEYQSAPLDIAEETFFYARETEARARFDRIRAATAAELEEMIGEVWEKWEGRLCVGVRWDLFERGDVVGIAKCIGGRGLAAICQLLCEDYAGRTAGVPDLVIWNEVMSVCKFVEVKGPGDNLQENQKVWIDVLQQANIPVEVCHVVERGAEKKKAPGKRGRPKKIVAETKKRKRSEPEDETTIVESEDEPEKVVSKLDLDTPEVPLPPPELEPELEPQPAPPPSPGTPRRRPTTQENVVELPSTPVTRPQTPSPRQRMKVEVVITTPSPARKRKRELSPEV